MDKTTQWNRARQSVSTVVWVGRIVGDMFDKYADPDRPRGLDGARRASGRSHNAEFSAAMTGATNLLLKAADAIWRDDANRADGLIARACTLPPQPDDGHPAVRAATQLIYDAVTDDVEDSTEGDNWWLEVALTALDSATGAGKISLASTMHEIPKVYFVSAEAESVIRNSVPAAPQDPEFDLTPESTPTELSPVVRQLMETFVAYGSARGGFPRPGSS